MEKPDVSLFDAMYTQRAIRSFKKELIPAGVVEAIVEAATKAPSGGNRQPWAFVAVQDRDLVAQFAVIARRGFERMYKDALARQEPGDPPPFPQLKPMIEVFEQVPCLMVVCGISGDEQADPRNLQPSVFPAVQNLLLAARGLDVGAVLTTGWAMGDLPAIRELIGLPDTVHPLAFVPMGYPDRARYGPTTRRPVSEVLHWDRWEEGRANSAAVVHR